MEDGCDFLIRRDRFVILIRVYFFNIRIVVKCDNLKEIGIEDNGYIVENLNDMREFLEVDFVWFLMFVDKDDFFKKKRRLIWNKKLEIFENYV